MERIRKHMPLAGFVAGLGGLYIGTALIGPTGTALIALAGVAWCLRPQRTAPTR